MIGIGLMSGTSLDGVDAALVEINGTGVDTKIRLIKELTAPYEAELKQQIKLACDPINSSTPLICQLNVTLGYRFLAACKRLCNEAGIPTDKIDFVASHGQTIWHAPSIDAEQSSTLQIGEAAIIAYGLQTTVVSDFRMMDMAAGGQGAPLVPYTEYILYQKKDKTRLLQNIGGIGNVTVLPKGGDLNSLFAFDTGPGNMMIDEAMNNYFNKPYDDNGTIASQGKVIQSLQKILHSHEYLTKIPPKSTGRELFGKDFTHQIMAKYTDYPPEDVIATFTDFTAYSIAESYRRYVFPITGLADIEVILSGGGAHNATLINWLQHYLPEAAILTQADIGHSNDAKEAVAFAILGNETLHGLPSNAPNATGAKRPVILGKIIPKPFF